MEHRLLTVMFVDMQGYTRRSAEQTIEEMKLFHDELRDFVAKSVEGHGGTLVKSLGDGFLVRFDTPTRAVQAGLELQKRIETRNQHILNPEKFVRFRIGINTGEVGIDEQGDLFGDPVNIASRIQNFAEPNAVFISESTYLAMNRNEFGAQDLGPQEFKNATREIRVYKIQGKMAGGGKSAGGAKVVARGGESSQGLDSKKKVAILVVVGVVVGLPLLGWGVRKMWRRDSSPPPVPMSVTDSPGTAAVHQPASGVPSVDTPAGKSPDPRLVSQQHPSRQGDPAPWPGGSGLQPGQEPPPFPPPEGQPPPFPPGQGPFPPDHPPPHFPPGQDGPPFQQGHHPRQFPGGTGGQGFPKNRQPPWGRPPGERPLQQAIQAGREVSHEMVQAIFRPLSIDLENTPLQIPPESRQSIDNLQKAVKQKDFKAAWHILDEMEKVLPPDDRQFIGRLSIGLTRVDVLGQAGRLKEAKEGLKKLASLAPRVPIPLQKGFSDRLDELARVLEVVKENR
jgi:class 3 adenylate cyclase